MKTPIAISIHQLSKCYHLYRHPLDRLSHALCKKGRRQEHWALKDISLTVQRGDAVGIIGHNGSGKSTLLQIIAGTMKPTSGQIIVNGRLAALLELGSGFNPEFTGRENVFLNGAILKIPHETIDRKFDEIAAFADIGDFMDQPVKKYSSGMMLRLAFAVQVVIEPDILIVDEALSVGDFFFQQKCLKKIRKLLEQGTTLLFVSHDMGIVRDLCRNVLYLKKGRASYWGQNLAGIRGYLSEGAGGSSPGDAAGHVAASRIQNDNALISLEGALWNNPLSGNPEQQKAEVLAVGVYDMDGIPAVAARMGTDVFFRVLYRAYTDESVHVALSLKNRYQQIVTATGSYTLGCDAPLLEPGDTAIFELRMTLMLEAGLYTFGVNVGGMGSGVNIGVVFHETPWMGPLKIVWDYENDKAPFLGMTGVPASGMFQVPS
jgi:lipopolysaccharide transport system ATP-binding protein